MRIGSRGILVALLLTSLSSWGAAQQAGTWKLNVAKSTFTADHPAPKSLLITITDEAGAMVLDVTGEDANGAPIHAHFSAKPDGMDYPVTGGPGGSDTVSLKRIDANTIETVSKKGGQVVTTVRSVVSPDGKTRTSTWQGKDSKRNPETWIQVYDKQ
jgi:hypothetical protein